MHFVNLIWFCSGLLLNTDFPFKLNLNSAIILLNINFTKSDLAQNVAVVAEWLTALEKVNTSSPTKVLSFVQG